MPELPFVTVVVENLAPLVAGRTVEDVVVRGVSVLKTVDPSIADLRGRRIAGVRRRAKLLLLDIAGGLLLVIHLRRNGRLRAVPRGTRRTARDLALVLALDRGPDIQMIEMGPKKAASVWVFRAEGLDAADPRLRGTSRLELHDGRPHVGRQDAPASITCWPAACRPASPLTGLGVEPFSPEFTPDALARMLRAARMRLKAFLVTQRYVVGTGNTYADEILWEARLSPQAMTTALGEDEVRRLHGAITSTLERGIDVHRSAAAGALPMKEPLEGLAVHRKGGEPCPRCGTPIAVIYYEDRETYYCPVCQAGGNVYSDRRRSRLLR
ncbi:MAG TPA: DNA-formamidopyrimidine glycosylase family protein [bacterium]|nr:DNA-formamidopyrimidine glycosylase family protein [bacterium]